MTRGRTDGDLEPGTTSDDAAPRLDARIEAQDGHEECTLFPADADEADVLTTWITAADDAFVSLAELR
jgi:hypothetical protein